MSNKIITAIPDEKQILQLKDMGFNDFNIHMVDKTITPQRIKQIVVSTGINVKSIHAPYSDSEEVLVENIDKYGAVHYAAMTAELLAKDEPIYLVCHTEFGATEYNHPDYLYKLSSSIDDLLNTHPHVILAIENTMLFNSYTQTISQSALPDYSKAIKTIKDLCDHKDRICSVLDVCHALSTIYAIKKVFPYWKINLEGYFSEAQDICSVIHVSNSYNYGYNANSHGVGFDSGFHDETGRLKHIVNLYEKYIPNALFVYEISESNYSERKELKNTIAAMEYLGFDPFE